jgi:hypothetical protein
MVCSFFVAQCRARKNNSSYKTQAVLVWIDTHFCRIDGAFKQQVGFDRATDLFALREEICREESVKQMK